MKRIKVGLALGSGAARGLAHIGVLKVLEEHNIPIDAVAGTSIGAVVGGLYAAGLGIDKLIDFARKFGGRNIAMWLDPTFFRGGGLLKGDRIEQAIRELVGSATISSLKTPFFAVSGDLSSGREVVIGEGDLVRAMRASFAIPGVLAPVKLGEDWLVDGAIVDPIPTKVLRDAGCDFVIAVNVNSSVKADEMYIFKKDNPGIIETIMQTLSIIQMRLSDHCLKLADISIAPNVGEYYWTDFSHVDELIKRGEEAGRESIHHIKGLLLRRRTVSFVKRIFSE